MKQGHLWILPGLRQTIKTQIVQLCAEPLKSECCAIIHSLTHSWCSVFTLTMCWENHKERDVNASFCQFGASPWSAEAVSLCSFLYSSETYLLPLLHKPATVINVSMLLFLLDVTIYGKNRDVILFMKWFKCYSWPGRESSVLPHYSLHSAVVLPSSRFVTDKGQHWEMKSGQAVEP